MKAAVFLDRDGVLNSPVIRDGEVRSPKNSDEFHIFEAAREPLVSLARQGLILIVVTNQPDLSRKLFTESDLQNMHSRLIQTLGGEKVIQDIFYCPHTADLKCTCRKPQPGMLRLAAGKWGLFLPGSFMIGDRDVDMLAAQAVGCRAVLLDYPYNQGVACDYRAKDIADAARWILKQEKIK